MPDSSREFVARAIASARRLPLATTACLIALVVACHGGVLFAGKQYGFRDTAHFYYPLYWRVQQEWALGHLPTWEPGANGGMPLLGSAMAAVLYPGKLVFAVLAYPWGVRVYIVGHEVLAFWAMLVLMRSWRISRAGATLAATSYAFGGPMLSGYFNVIYLVGAAWLPLGFRGVDRWVRLGRRAGLVELALVLAMQVLGGDPEAAYLTVVCGFGYAFFLRRPEPATRRPWLSWAIALLAIAGVWVWAGPWLARRLHGGNERWTQLGLVVLWSLAMAGFAARRGREARTRIAGLGAAGLLGLLLAAAQVVPVLAQIVESVRWSGAGMEDLFDSSLLPYRLLETIWPGVFGSFTAGNRYWERILPPEWAHRPSPISLYFGALPLVLALAAAGSRGRPPWAAWISGVGVLSLWAGLGAFAGPGAWSGGDGAPTAGDDSFYGLLTTVLPGLRLFRFPFKVLSFTSLSVAALAGLGWDRCRNQDDRRRAGRVAMALIVLSLLGLATAVVARGGLHDRIAVRAVDHLVYGPLDVAGATGQIVLATLHGSCALALGLAMLAWSMGRARAAAPASLALILVAADIGLANAPLVVTVPQADYAREPEALRAIREAEHKEPGPGAGPIRIQRMPSWIPIGWAKTRSSTRLRDLVDWEIDTLQPSFGWLHGVQYVFVDESETGRVDQRQLFRPGYRLASPAVAASLGVEPGRIVLWHARRAFDLWGARYFILPADPGDWTGIHRSYAAFLEETDLIDPDLPGPEPTEDRRRWRLGRDFQVRRNRRAFPRAWIVREARLLPPVDDSPTTRRTALIARLRADEDPRASASIAPAPDLRHTAYIETDDPASLGPYLWPHDPVTGTPAGSPKDTVDVLDEASGRVRLDVVLNRPAIVVLADAFDPGWRATLDGQAAPVLRANRLMRAVAVPAGRHEIVYTFRPVSVLVGLGGSLAGMILLACTIVWSRNPRRARRMAPGSPCASQPDHRPGEARTA
ncbi:MAG: hypothetical protein ACYC61_00070 [Isosphaeraceae bacterium]